jgi:hypothetical protein
VNHRGVALRVAPPHRVSPGTRPLRATDPASLTAGSGLPTLLLCMLALSRTGMQREPGGAW